MQTELSEAEGNDSIEFTVVFFRDNLTAEVVVEFYTESGSAEGMCEYTHVAVTSRKRTLFHCKWANSIGYISRMLY